MTPIPCQLCNAFFPAAQWTWWVCNVCGFRVCPPCLGKQKGPYGSGHKCGRCPHGRLASTR